MGDHATWGWGMGGEAHNLLFRFVLALFAWDLLGQTKLLPQGLEITPAGSLYYSRGPRSNRINPWTDAARSVHAHLARLKLLPRNVEITPECALQMVEIIGRDSTRKPPQGRPCN